MKYLWNLYRRQFLKLQVFYINIGGLVCCYLQAARESILVKIQIFTINSSDGVCDEACFYLRAVAVCLK